MWQVFKPARRKVGAFSAGRSPQDDDQFLHECGVSAGTERGNVALAVRRTVAKLGKADPLLISAADRYPEELSVLPFWDSIDFLGFVLEMELALGRKLPAGSRDFIPDNEPLTVAFLARRVFELLGERTST